MTSIVKEIDSKSTIVPSDDIVDMTTPAMTEQRVRIPLSPIENLAVGAFGGALETCLQMPILTYKFCLQEGRSLPKSLAGWYRGIAVQAGTIAPITAIQFAANGFLQKMVLSFSSGGTEEASASRELTDIETMSTAAGAGAISACVYSPVDLITIQQQKMQLSPWNTMQRIVQSYGTGSLFRGFASCAVREAVYTAGYLGLAPVITVHLVGEGKNGVFSGNTFLSGIAGSCIAGTTAALLTHPVDTAKTCIQSDMTGKTWSSARAAMLKLMTDSGVGSLYRGFVPRTIRLCGAFFVCTMVRDLAIEAKTARKEDR